MSEPQVVQRAKLIFDRGLGLPTLLTHFRDREDVKLVSVIIKASGTRGLCVRHQVGPFTVLEPKGGILSPQKLSFDDLEDAERNLETYTLEITKLIGDPGVFERTNVEKIYVLDKETDNVAELGLVPKRELQITPEHQRYVKRHNPRLQVPLQFTGEIYRLDESGELKKYNTLPETDHTADRFKVLFPNLSKILRLIVCQLVRTAGDMKQREDFCNSGIFTVEEGLSR